MAGLINSNGTLYGTTSWGSTVGGGTVFSIDPTNGDEAVIYSFGSQLYDGASPWAGLINVKGALYGTTDSGGEYEEGTVFSVDPISGDEAVIHSFGGHRIGGAYPVAGLVAANGRLYGTTYGGGRTRCDGYGCGTVFVIKP
jgi:uncharacterized repeat protein (TIGR03803 family)